MFYRKDVTLIFPRVTILYSRRLHAARILHAIICVFGNENRFVSTGLE